MNAQTFTYEYTDPCKGTTKSIDVPTNGVTVSYYGQINTFQPVDFYNGNFESWTNSVFSSFGNLNPCATVIGLPTALDIAQNTIINFVSVLNSISAITDLSESISGGATNILSGVNSIQNSSNNKNKNNSKNKKNGNNTNSISSNNTGNVNGTNNHNNVNSGIILSQENDKTETRSSETGKLGGGSNINNGRTEESERVTGNNTTGNNIESNGERDGTTNGISTSVGSNGSTTKNSDGDGDQGSKTEETTKEKGEGGKNNETLVNQDNNSNTFAGSDGSQNNETSNQTNTQNDVKTEEGGKTNILGGAVNTIDGVTSGSPSNKNGNRPSILVSSDFVGFNFKNTDVNFGGKVTGGYTSMSWDGKRTYGFLADYTTALKGPNVTGFFALVSKKRLDVFSGTISVGFDRRITAYGTISAGQMWILDKRKMVKVVYMITGSYGNVFGKQFVGTAAIAGAVGDFKIGKRFDIKAMMLYVYAPYVSYYNDILLKSPHVVLPILGFNIRLTKRFKLNINGSGAWAIKEATLNYSIMMGARVLI